MTRFKPCPFCGEAPEQRHQDYDFLGCSNVDCDLNGVEIQEDYWNKRYNPEIEDGKLGEIIIDALRTPYREVEVVRILAAIGPYIRRDTARYEIMAAKQLREAMAGAGSLAEAINWIDDLIKDYSSENSA